MYLLICTEMSPSTKIEPACGEIVLRHEGEQRKCRGDVFVETVPTRKGTGTLVSHPWCQARSPNVRGDSGKNIIQPRIS